MMSHTASAASLSLSRAASTSSVTAINGPSSGSPSPGTDPRRRHRQKDDAIRRKVDQELARKTGGGGSAASRRSTHGHHGHHGHGHQQAQRLPHAKAGTVAALRPSAPVTIRQSVKVLDAAQLMAARRCDALLVVDQQDRLCGIVTDKDLAFRVVAEGLDLNSTKVFEIMTKNVQFVNANQTASEALSTMIAGAFRHLPVMDDEGDVVGVLDITKCLYEALERIDTIYGSSKKLTEALEDVQRDWASTGINAALSQQFEMIRQKMLCPDLNSILSAESLMPPELGLKANVRDAARAMKQFKSTAVLIFDESTTSGPGGRKLAGIFTSKDIVLRVMSVKADPGATSIIRVMTPHPDTVATHTTIYDALKMMHDNKYLHLPVVDAGATDDAANQQVIGLVDVLKLTYNVLEKIQSAREQDGGPAWNEFWTSTFAPEGMSASAGGPGADTESLMSGTLADRTMHSTPSMIRPSDSASVVSDALSGFMPPPTASASASASASAAGTSGVPGFDPAHCFVFKFRDPSTLAVHRVTSPTNLAFLVSLLKEKIGQHVEINTLSYADEDGDDIAVQCDADLAAAVAMARDAGLRRILLKLNGVSGAAEQPEYPRRRASGMTNNVDDAATDLYSGGAAGVPSAIPEVGMSVRPSRGATAMSALSGVSERSAEPAAAALAAPVERGTIVPTTGYAVAAPAPSAAAAAKRVTWLDRLVGAENALEHPVVLVGMGAVVTLSLVGLVSLIRK